MSFGGGVEFGAWTEKGEPLGSVTRLREPEGKGYAYLSVGRGSDDRGMSMTLYRFRGGYRVRLEEWEGEERRSRWLAPEVEDEGYIGLFSEGEAREAFPYLFAALDMPGGLEVE